MITVNMPASTKINFVTLANGEVGFLKLSENKLNLIRGRIYKIPVNTTEKLDDYNLLKLIGKVAENLEIRNIENGIAIVMPIVHNTIIHDGMELGKLI